MTDAVALTEPDVAVIVTVPPATDVTNPTEETIATVESDVVHVTVASVTSVPVASLTVAVSCVVSPSASNASTESDNTRLAADCATVTFAVPLAEPEEAVIVAEPLATEVTRPEEDTVATAASDVAHVTVALLIARPF